MKAFRSADILLPKNAPFQSWAVIACDQFTSDRQYWDRVAEKAGDNPSAFYVVYPEIDLENNPQQRIKKINDTMVQYVQENVFETYKNSFVYVERTLLDGSVRPGIVGAVDLEQYHYDPKFDPAIGATEQTILERVPPRIAIRRNAELEFPHIILFCNDVKNALFSHIQSIKDRLPKLYDFMLMEDGGHIAGWLLSGDDAVQLQEQIDRYMDSTQGISLLVADGNHSLVTAKHWYEELKANHPNQDLSNHPARFAMVELENIQDPSIQFEAIHRVIFETDPENLLSDIQEICCDDGCEIPWIAGNKRGILKISVPEGELPVAVLQRFLDRWLAENDGRIDYIHDIDAVEKFAGEEKAIGLILPSFDKGELFEFGASGHILPRKTFSLGHGREKRYYLEGRLIR